MKTSGKNVSDSEKKVRIVTDIDSAHLLGAHMPTTGGLHNSLLGGHKIGCSAVQLFTANPKQWQMGPLSADVIAAFRDAQEQTGIASTVSHDSHLINLAAPDVEI